jgi:hypothetical protein
LKQLLRLAHRRAQVTLRTVVTVVRLSEQTACKQIAMGSKPPAQHRRQKRISVIQLGVLDSDEAESGDSSSGSDT